jgi:hypothetical protein
MDKQEKDLLSRLNKTNQLIKSILFDKKKWFSYNGKAYAFPNECYSNTILTMKKPVVIKPVIVDSKMLFEVYKGKKEEPITGINLEENLMLYGEEYPLFESITSKVIKRNIESKIKLFDDLKQNSKTVAIHDSIENFYTDCGKSEFVDLMISKNEFAINNYSISTKHRVIRLAQKLFLKSEEGATHQITLRTLSNNRLLFELECDSKNYSYTQDFLLVDF